MKSDKAILKLFNSLLVDNKTRIFDFNQQHHYLKQLLKVGILINPNVALTNEIVKDIIEIHGIDAEKLNQGFYKSWNKIATISDIELLHNQILHYITTYGFESIGQFNHNTVYIPHEKLDIPELTSGFNFIVIKSISKFELLQEIFKLQKLALKQDTIQDLLNIIIDNDLLNHYDLYKGNFDNKEFLDNITNRELKIAIYKHFDIVPNDVNEFFRYLIYVLTGETLVIKNKHLFQKLKQSDKTLALKLLKIAPKNLSSIFLRNKMLFLALKGSNKELNTIINGLKTKSKKTHSPLKENVLKTITEKLSSGKFLYTDVFTDELISVLEETSSQNLVRIINSLKNKIANHAVSEYKIRNGKSWVEQNNRYINNTIIMQINYAIMTLETIISARLISKLHDKKILLSKDVIYACPLSEKNFTGNIPNGSYIEFDGNNAIILGVHWYNKEMDNSIYGERVDLDLSLVSMTEKYGWNGKDRNYDRSIMFSGDMTNAPRPHGASEFFYIENKSDLQKFLLFVNNFTHNPNVEAEIVIAKTKLTNELYKQDYLIHPDNIIFKIGILLDSDQLILGLIEHNRFYFYQTKTKNIIVSSENETNKMLRSAMIDYAKTNVSLNELLENSGINIIYDEIADMSNVIDLRVNSLTKTTLIDLMDIQ